jgi:hypothetical protein
MARHGIYQKFELYSSRLVLGSSPLLEAVNDLSHLEDGIYFVEIENTTTKVVMKLILNI